MVNLGDKVRDRINGYEGVVTGRAEYLYGCIQVLVAPASVGKDGKHPEAVWLDEDRVLTIKARAVVNVEAAKRPAIEARAGGPLVAPAPPVR